MKFFITQLLKQKISICFFIVLLAFTEGKAQINFIVAGGSCFNGTGNWSFDTPVGSRNSYVRSSTVFISWSIANNRWEIRNNSTLIFYNNFASIPNPPDQNTGTWVSANDCVLGALTGAWTQNFLFPTINIQGNSTNIINGATTTTSNNHTHFGGFAGTPIVRTYTILNPTTNPIILTGTAPNYVTITGGTDFTTITQPNSGLIVAGGSLTFQVQFSPTTNGFKNATINIPNDLSNYTFAISGTTTEKVRGNMITLNGSSQYISTNSPLTTATNNVTMEAWVNFQSATTGATCIFYNGDNFGNGYGLYLFGGTYQILQGGVQLLNTGVLPTLNTWTHLALTINGGIWTVYQDGIVILITSAGAPIAPTTNFRVGANSSGTSEFLNAQVDEVRFWNVVRTATQLRENMHLTLNGNEAGLTAYYQFNETSGNAIDVVGVNNATLQGGTPRVPSTLSVGGGVSKLVSVTNVTGGFVEINLTTTNMEIDFASSSANPNNSVVVTNITAENPFNNTNSVASLFGGYWVVRNFGTNTGLSFNNIKAKILPANNIPNDDLTTPSNLKLFTRINNSGTSTWSQVGSANSADDVTKEINFNSPTNTFLGEFVVGTNTIPISPFITTWKTTTGTITIPTFTGETYNYNITWTNLTNAGAGDGSVTNVTGDYTITGLTNNDTYKVEISGTFPRIYFSFNPERLKIQTIEQWGSITWSSMHRAFSGCANLTHNATIAPNLTNVTDMSYMFGDCPLFNGNIGNWNTANVTNMSGLFGGCTVFNQNIGSWNTANVTNMSDMFTSASTFNQNIGNWNVSNVTDMSYMFSRATSFNQNINNWTTSNVTNMSNMFEQANSFNQPLINWNVSNVTNMTYMFRANTAFNQSLSTGMFSGWNTANVTSMNGMFFGATNFNQNIGGLNISNVTDMNFMLINCGMTTFNYDNTLIGFQFQANNYFVQPNITIGVDGLRYCQGLNARNTLISTRNWTFVGDALACPFITTWVTTTTTITIPTTGTGYNYSITWENLSNFGVGNGSATGITGNYTITGLTNGNLYQISIAGNFPRIFFVNGDGQAPKLRTVVQWGNIAWTSMASAFNGCSNLTTIPTTEAPNLSNVTDMSNMFAGASQMNSNISNWNVSNITNMSKLFEGATQFNQNIASWNVSNVTNMSSMFSVATAFNQDISGWNVGNVTNMSFMFAGFMTLTNFNQNINSWNVSNVTNMEGMFQRSVFNQNISGWNVGNVTNMQSMFFNNTLFNQNIGSWNVGNVTNMSSMFSGATNFNQNIGSWNVSNVTNMQSMFFNNTIFNQNIGSWNVGNVTNMSVMFGSTLNFNQDISTWNVANVTNMTAMFNGATSFNQNISSWNVSSVTNMRDMFLGATSFNQNLASWNITNVINMMDIFSNTNISLSNYDAILISFASQSVKPNVLFAAIGRVYCNGAAARSLLISTKNWTFSGDAIRCVNVSQKRGNALVFSGGTQSALTSNVVISASNNVSIEGWVNFNSTGGGGAICIFYNGNNFANGYGLYLLSNRIQILFGGITLTDTGITPSLNTWIHLALVNNGTSWAVYQNGVQIGANFFISAIAPTNNFRIGSNVNGTAEFLNGQVDEVRVWNIGISATQIRENMHLTLNGSQSNLINYYQFNETSGNNVVDGISTRNITLNNVTRTTSTLAVASGSFHRRNISVGMNNFTNANVTINFTNAPLDEFVAYQLNDNPINGVNINNLGSSPSCYWIVRQFGGGAVAYNQMNFTLPASNTISAVDEATPSNLKLYKRPDNSTAVFGASIANATTANNTTKIIEFAGLSETSFSQFEISSAFSPLPVTLLGWRAERLERGGEKTEEIKLSWETATEINNKGFEIESSENAVSFTKTAFVDGAGNSNNLKNYQLTIENSNDAYYRLKQIDFDGKFSYSDIVFVRGTDDNSIKVYPNPVSEKIHITTSKESFSYKITTLQGNDIIEGNTIKNSESIDITSLPKGLYIIRIMQNNKIITKKMIVQ